TVHRGGHRYYDTDRTRPSISRASAAGSGPDRPKPRRSDERSRIPGRHLSSLERLLTADFPNGKWGGGGHGNDTNAARKFERYRTLARPCGSPTERKGLVHVYHANKLEPIAVLDREQQPRIR